MAASAITNLYGFGTSSVSGFPVDSPASAELRNTSVLISPTQYEAVQVFAGTLGNYTLTNGARVIMTSGRQYIFNQTVAQVTTALQS